LDLANDGGGVEINGFREFELWVNIVMDEGKKGEERWKKNKIRVSD